PTAPHARPGRCRTTRQPTPARSRKRSSRRRDAGPESPPPPQCVGHGKGVRPRQAAGPPDGGDARAQPRVAGCHVGEQIRGVWLEDGAIRAVGPPDLLADVAACDAGLGTSVATVWRTSGLPGPYPLTVAHALRRWR